MIREQAQQAFDAKTKPRGSLGRLEEIACTIAEIRGTASPGSLRSVVVVAAADHGVAAEGVSAYPQEVTRQMLATFESGGSAVCVLARQAGAELRIVDAGVGQPTGNIAEGPAMTRADAQLRIDEGVALAAKLADEGFGVIALGEMGIGNTTSAAALAAALLPAVPAAVCGRGTGLDEAGVRHKVTVVERALHANAVDRSDALGTLAALGGYEIAVLCGLVLGAAARRLVLLLDGFITAAAALVATRIDPTSRHALVAAHLSSEPAHSLLLQELGLVPLLDLQLRLGEGSGAALALPLLDASLALLAEMATFESARVTDSGH